MAVNKDKIVELIKSLEADINMLEFEESYQRHEPAYYNYVTYYEDLVEILLSLGGKTNLSLFGTYLVGLFAYHVMEQEKPLYEAVQIILDELRIKLQELEVAEIAKPGKKKKEPKKEEATDDKKYDA